MSTISHAYIPLNILIVENSQDDADLLVAELRRAGYAPQWKRVETASDFLAELEKKPDIILSDYAMPEFSGLRAIELLAGSGLGIPFILISGTVGEDTAVEAMKMGAADYTVLTAANGVEALTLAHQKSTGHIDLLFTDVVMPHMSGKELSDRVRSLFPQTKILFTSAYAENAIVHQGVLNPGVELFQKPFTPSALAHKLREILNAKND
jgi:CheY-like chemotaxis protein